MRMQPKCIPCIVNQAIKIADMVGVENKNELLKKVFAYLSQVDYDTAYTPELIGEIFALLKEETGDDDPYKETRDFYNHMFLEQMDELEHEVESASDSFLESIKFAIIGNIIDFNPMHSISSEDVKDYFSRLKKASLEMKDMDELKEDIVRSNTILYLGDNCGEICLDKILLKKMKQLNPMCQIYFATRGSAVVNDSVKEDAYAVGIQDYATVIDNGDISLGTVLYRTSEEFQQIYHKADIVISKGQANYECLSNEEKNIYFLLMTKCKVIADDIGASEMKMICKRNDRKKK